MTSWRLLNEAWHLKKAVWFTFTWTFTGGRPITTLSANDNGGHLDQISNKYNTPNICISLKYIYRGLQHLSVTEFSALVLWCTSKGTHCCVFTCYLQLSCTTGPAKLVLCPTRIVRHVSGINVQNKQVPVLQHPDAGGGVPGVQSQLHIVLQPGVSGRGRSFRITRICDVPANDTKHDVNQGLFYKRWRKSCKVYKPCLNNGFNSNSYYSC